MTADLAGSVIDEFARGDEGPAPTHFRARFDRVLLQRAWKVCGTFARAVAQGKGEVYRRYLPGEVAPRRAPPVGNSPRTERFRRVFEARLAPLC